MPRQRTRPDHCIEPHCTRSIVHARGLCRPHYSKFRRHHAIERTTLTETEALQILASVLPARTPTVQRALEMSLSATYYWLEKLGATQNGTDTAWRLPCP